jgi:iron complex outermembrane receptor protein
MTNSPATTRRLLLAGAAAFLPAMAHGQTAPGAASASVASTQIQEIVVTAQRREQRFEDVGITMNVLSGKDIIASGVKQVVDLSDQVPNVQIKNVLGNSIPNVTIRGIGLNDYASNNNPAVGVYVDNVYLVSPAMLSFGLFDIDRVEILKGPQGDLYGRNTTGGALNVISRQPTATPDLEIETGYGSYENWHLNAAVGGPIAPTLEGRLAIATEQQYSGWQTNYVTGQKWGKIHRTFGRLQLAWTPTDSLRVRFSAHGGYDKSDEALYKVLNTTTNEWVPFANQPYTAGGSDDPHVDNTSFGTSLTVDWKLSDRLTLTSVSAYEHLSRIDVADQDGTSLRQLDSTFYNRINQESEELRLAYSQSNLTLIFGGYYSHDTVHDRDTYKAGDLLPLLGLPGLTLIGNTYDQKTDSYAAFVHGEWTFAPRLTLIVGLRYTDDQKTLDNATTFLGTAAGVADVFPPPSNSFSSGALSGKLGLNFKATDHTLLYATVSRGFKSGGFQGQLTFDPDALKPFKDEFLTAYEVGAKSRLLPNLQVNASAFYYDYHDAQFYGPLFNSPVGVLFGIANVGDARVIGVEGDAQWRPAAGLDVRLGTGYIDTKITKSIVPGVATGSELPDAPRWTLDGSIKYAWNFSPTLGADVTLSGRYQSTMAFDIVRNPPEAVEGGYFVANGELGLNIGDHYRLSFYAKNFAGQVYKTQALFTSVGWSYQYGAPRTFGVNFSYKM